MVCPRCGKASLFHYDRVWRIIRMKDGKISRVRISRNKCRSCGCVLRELPSCLLPRKQYEAEIIFGVVEGLITSDTLGFEDHPCEITMRRWREEFHRSCFAHNQIEGYSCHGGDTDDDIHST